MTPKCLTLRGIGLPNNWTNSRGTIRILACTFFRSIQIATSPGARLTLHLIAEFDELGLAALLLHICLRVTDVYTSDIIMEQVFCFGPLDLFALQKFPP